MTRTNYIKILLGLLVCFIVLGGLYSIPNQLQAQGDGVVLLQPIEQFGITRGETTDIGTYLNNLFRLGIALATGFAILLMVIGGINYMVTGSIQGKAEGRDMIQRALYGLIIALAAFAILQTINPEIVKLRFIERLEKASEQDIDFGNIEAAGGDDDGVGSEEEQALRQEFESNNILVNNSPCGPGEGVGDNCTNLAGLPQQAIDGLIALQNSCSCTVTVTGGTEPGHKTHGPGVPAVDLRSATRLNELITDGQNVALLDHGDSFNFGGASFTWEELGVSGSTGRHWHVVF